MSFLGHVRSDRRADTAKLCSTGRVAGSGAGAGAGAGGKDCAALNLCVFGRLSGYALRSV